MKTKDGKTKVYITENGHTRTVDISEISDVPVKGARDITEEYYNAHKEIFEQLGYEETHPAKMLDIYEMSRNYLRNKSYDVVGVFNNNIPVKNLLKKIDPFDADCKIWTPPQEDKNNA